MSPKQLFLNPFFFLVCVIAGVLSFFYIDKNVGLYVGHDLTNSARTLFGYVTLPGKAKYPLILLVLLVLYAKFISKNKTLLWACIYLIAGILVSGIICDIFKISLSRARPHLLLSQGLYGFYGFKFTASMWSFPSGHSTTLGSMAMGLALMFRRFAWLIVIVGFLMACCRVLAGMHYPSDVLTGYYLGCVSSILLFKYFEPRMNANGVA